MEEFRLDPASGALLHFLQVIRHRLRPGVAERGIGRCAQLELRFGPRPRTADDCGDRAGGPQDATPHLVSSRRLVRANLSAFAIVSDPPCKPANPRCE